MAYQNVGAPRLYINELTWLKSMGVNITISTSSATWELNSGDMYNLLDSDPTNGVELLLAEESHPGNDTFYIRNRDFPSAPGLNYFVAVLNHNFRSKSAYYRLDAFGANTDDYNQDNLPDNPQYSWYGYEPTKIINGENVANTGYEPQHDGFSIATYTSQYTDRWRFQINPAGATEYNNPPDEIGFFYNYTFGIPLKMGSIFIGQYFDMPHNANLNLSMTRSMDGIKTTRNRGGQDFNSIRYTKPPKWGNRGAWELFDPENDIIEHQKFSKIGRRSWKLSFDFVNKNKMFPPTETQLSKIIDTTGYTEGTDYLSNGEWYKHNKFLSHSDFYTQVVHKTNGLQNPVIFQADSNNNNPDQFALVKIYNLNIQKINDSLFNVSMVLKEIW